ncbi:interferon-induced, double-stranded RNA-activated protein kinase isoform X2 [Lampris incognitus]|uniref:interferon-induced, double-stranded RNA-activated protein kinase isoform X2 n=1 Tax=Lampris incognitus TaxID=2546036 RepID=UPI0024B57789|nr:interferon-induced, double-stranded RNA-activated protein kinase isoform X2 [Lampris incognitus]
MASGQFVAKLNEYAQKSRLTVTYDDVGCAGPDHSRTFTQRAVVNGQTYPEGVGKSKKEAKQEAAKHALNELMMEGTDPPDSSQPTVDNHPPPVIEKSISQPNYICWLNEYSQKKRVALKAKESTKVGVNNVTPCCMFVVGGKEYPVAYGKTKKEAKEEAAKIVFDELCGGQTTGTMEEYDSYQSSDEKENLNQSTSENTERTKNMSVDSEQTHSEINYIGIINNHCQKLNCIPDFKFVNRCGPPHNPEFIYKVVIGKTEYPEGVGKSAKEARQNAAQLAVSAIQEQSNSSSKMSTSSEDGSPSRLSTSSTLGSTGSFSTPSTTSHSNSIIFADSSPPARSPDVKPKRRLAPKFSSAAEKHAVNPDVKEREKGNCPSKENVTETTTSRFLTEFDSIAPVGKGGFGTVLKATRNLDGRHFAVKIVRSKPKALREIGALTDLQHCNIVRYYTSWQEDSNYICDSSTQSSSSSQSSSNSPRKYLYIQMEFCENGTLRIWIDNMNDSAQIQRREESLSIMQQIVDGVAYVHSNKLFHRDLKPVNILFGKNNNVKIGDFGLVTAEDDDNDEIHMERTERTGTPSYMAPEQKSQKNYDRKVDIFALGLIYFELLWKLDSKSERAAVWSSIRSQNLPLVFPQKFPEEHKLIKSMLCEKPENRPEARKVKTSLEKCSDAINREPSHHINRTV